MCMDSEWMKWADAWSNKKDYAADALGISYMLAGDGGRAMLTHTPKARRAKMNGLEKGRI